MESNEAQSHDQAGCSPKSPVVFHEACTSSTCQKCGGPTAYPVPPVWSQVSPPPNYRPIRAPAVNMPMNRSKEEIMLTPVPQARKVEVVSPPYHFHAPEKRIQSVDDIKRFQESETCKNFLGFVVSLSESVRGRKISDACHVSVTVSSIVSIMETLINWIDEIPLFSRLLDSFGNTSRIDYGTGHETNFVAWLYCLARIGIIGEEDFHAVVCRAFVKYLELMRKLQMVYCLEPAGSHGVWGLDDYHFMPFIFGSSQLIDHKYMKPKSIHNDDILENFANEYMYLSCIAFVKKVKKGLFAEHSPLLDDISGVPNWKKVNGGLLKMYKVEVLEKVPIMQHFLFGWLIKWYGFFFISSF
ncbi:unnamed protein product [Rhodiola kirilowii]